MMRNTERPIKRRGRPLPRGVPPGREWDGEAAEDGAAEDGAAEDGAAEAGVVEEGAAEDGVVEQGPGGREWQGPRHYCCVPIPG